MSSDAETVIFSTAGLLHVIIDNCDDVNDVDYITESPAISIIGDFIIRCVLAPSIRRRLTVAETCFLLNRWAPEQTAWPRSFMEIRQFLADFRRYVQSFVVDPKIYRLWAEGFLFFGSPNVVKMALIELKLNTHTDFSRLVISAGLFFFCGHGGPRRMRHLTYCLFDSKEMHCLEPHTVFLYRRALVLCADSRRREYFFMLTGE